MVCWLVVVEEGPAQLTPMTAITSNQCVPVARFPLVHEVAATPLAMVPKPEVADVVESSTV